jgi:CDP-paratose 2-epimerase
MKKYLITGGAGFIGCNYVNRLLARGEEVHIYDNLSRRGAARNVEWLRGRHGQTAFNLVTGDVRDAVLLEKTAAGMDVIVHLAGQVAVTTSVIEPREDFEVNALGTFNVLEAARKSGRDPVVLYASTNKVYGGMEDVRVLEQGDQYAYADYPQGIAESHPLDFHSPYGCSKGAGDQYTRDYHRIYGLPSVVLRQSCIYGTRQFGIEDQGWVAWFVIAALKGKPITIYGDGKQVRDILFVEDLLNAYDRCIERIDKTAGQVYNIGGGSANTLSVWTQFAPILERLLGVDIPVKRADWRPGDQLVFVSDTRKAKEALDWTPQYNVEKGITELFTWVKNNLALFDV